MFRQNRAIVFEAVQSDGLALQFASSALQEDKEVVLTAIRRRGCAYQFCKLFQQEDVLLAALRAPHSDEVPLLKFASDEIRDKPSIVDQAICRHAGNLPHASQRLRTDPDSACHMLSLVKPRPLDKYLGESNLLLWDKTFLPRILRMWTGALGNRASVPAAKHPAKCVLWHLSADWGGWMHVPTLLSLVQANGFALTFIPKDSFYLYSKKCKNIGIIRAAVRQNGLILCAGIAGIDKKWGQHPRVVAEAVIQNADVIKPLSQRLNNSPYIESLLQQCKLCEDSRLGADREASVNGFNCALCGMQSCDMNILLECPCDCGPWSDNLSAHPGLEAQENAADSSQASTNDGRINTKGSDAAGNQPTEWADFLDDERGDDDPLYTQGSETCKCSDPLKFRSKACDRFLRRKGCSFGRYCNYCHYCAKTPNQRTRNRHCNQARRQFLRGDSALPPLSVTSGCSLTESIPNGAKVQLLLSIGDNDIPGLGSPFHRSFARANERLASLDGFQELRNQACKSDAKLQVLSGPRWSSPQTQAFLFDIVFPDLRTARLILEIDHPMELQMERQAIECFFYCKMAQLRRYFHPFFPLCSEDLAHLQAEGDAPPPPDLYGVRVRINYLKKAEAILLHHACANRLIFEFRAALATCLEDALNWEIRMCRGESIDVLWPLVSRFLGMFDCRTSSRQERLDLFIRLTECAKEQWRLARDAAREAGCWSLAMASRLAMMQHEAILLMKNNMDALLVHLDLSEIVEAARREINSYPDSSTALANLEWHHEDGSGMIPGLDRFKHRSEFKTGRESVYATTATKALAFTVLLLFWILCPLRLKNHSSHILVPACCSCFCWSQRCALPSGSLVLDACCNTVESNLMSFGIKTRDADSTIFNPNWDVWTALHALLPMRAGGCRTKDY